MRISHSKTTSLAMEMVRAALQHQVFRSMAQVDGRWLQSDIAIESQGGLAYQDQRHLSMKIDVIFSPNSKNRNWVEGLIKVDGMMSISREWAKININFIYLDVSVDEGKVAHCTFICQTSRISGKILIRLVENISTDAPRPVIIGNFHTPDESFLS